MVFAALAVAAAAADVWGRRACWGTLGLGLYITSWSLCFYFRLSIFVAFLRWNKTNQGLYKRGEIPATCGKVKLSKRVLDISVKGVWMGQRGEFVSDAWCSVSPVILH